MINFLKKKDKSKGQRDEDLPLENFEFPDSERPHGLCPRCNKQSSFEIIGQLPATFDSNASINQLLKDKRNFYDRVVSLICRNCTQPTIVFEECYIDDNPLRKGMRPGTINWKGFFWWPFPNLGNSDHIPEQIRSCLSEAKLCFAVGSYRAASVMARRTLEAITVDKGEIDGSLASRIKKLVEEGQVDKTLGEWATEIRLIGNNGAHFDPINNIQKSDADQIILFIDELLKYLYIMPKEIEKRRQRK